MKEELDEIKDFFDAHIPKKLPVTEKDCEELLARSKQNGTMLQRRNWTLIKSKVHYIIKPSHLRRKTKSD